MIIYYESGNIRINKDGTIDRRYRGGRNYVRTHNDMPVKPTETRRPRKANRTVAFTFFFYLAFMGGYMWGADSLSEMSGKELVKPYVKVHNVVHAQEPAKGESVEDLIASYNWDVKTATAVFKCENDYRSRGYWDPSATHANDDGSKDYGIAQINQVHLLGECQDMSVDDLKKPEKNLECASRIHQDGGFGPWVCYTEGYYLPYME